MDDAGLGLWFVAVRVPVLPEFFEVGRELSEPTFLLLAEDDAF